MHATPVATASLGKPHYDEEDMLMRQHACMILQHTFKASKSLSFASDSACVLT